jgi:CDP-diglyceride synthetase
LLAGLAGALGGIATGVVLSLLVVRFVELTANATSPEPPLELVPDWPLLAVAGVLAAIAAVALVGAATWRAFRGRVPARYGGAA